jgi:hypothetical protein
LSPLQFPRHLGEPRHPPASGSRASGSQARDRQAWGSQARPGERRAALKATPATSPTPVGRRASVLSLLTTAATATPTASPRRRPPTASNLPVFWAPTAATKATPHSLCLVNSLRISLPLQQPKVSCNNSNSNNTRRRRLRPCRPQSTSPLPPLKVVPLPGGRDGSQLMIGPQGSEAWGVQGGRRRPQAARPAGGPPLKRLQRL